MSINDAPEAQSDAPPSPPARPNGDAKVKDGADRPAIAAVRAAVGQVFIGPEEVVEALLIALFARGHVLLEGVPGVAKTTLVRTFARTLDASFKRIQFTPDLLPSDITGVYIPNLRTPTR